ncbi:MAG: hypothetical protein LBV51_02185 [Acholeplasmatales bacterium]|jgi:hypothetical protein|nr:hypothetical protein [Acholeplasmatales bacterium]
MTENKCFKCVKGTNPKDVRIAKNGDIVYISGNPEIYYVKEDGTLLGLDKVYVSSLNPSDRGSGTNKNKCFKVPYQFNKSLLVTVSGDVVYASGDPFVYLHSETVDGYVVWVSIEKTNFN